MTAEKLHLRASYTDSAICGASGVPMTSKSFSCATCAKCLAEYHKQMAQFHQVRARVAAAMGGIA